MHIDYNSNIFIPYVNPPIIKKFIEIFKKYPDSKLPTTKELWNMINLNSV